MTSDDKTNPAPKSGTAVKKRPLRRKMRARRRTRRRQTQTYLRLRAARKLPSHPQVIVGARAKNPDRVRSFGGYNTSTQIALIRSSLPC